MGHSWRTHADISLTIEADWRGVIDNLDAMAGLARFAGPGGWNDAGAHLSGFGSKRKSIHGWLVGGCIETSSYNKFSSQWILGGRALERCRHTIIMVLT